MFQLTNNLLLKKHKYWLILIFLITIIFSGLYSIYFISSPILKIAYIGAYKVEDFEQFHIEILTKYAKDLSQKFPKFDVEIVPFSIDDNIEKYTPQFEGILLEAFLSIEVRSTFLITNEYSNASFCLSSLENL